MSLDEPTESVQDASATHEYYAELSRAYEQAVREELRRIAEEEAALRQDESQNEAPERSGGIVASLMDRLPRGLGPLKRHRRGISYGLAAFLAIMIACSVYSTFFLSRTVHYSFANASNCVVSPVVFPGMFKSQARASVKISHPASVSLFRTKLFAYRMCSAAEQPLSAAKKYSNTQSLAIFGLHVKKSVSISTGKYPLVSSVKLDPKAMLLIQPAQFKLSSADATFDYAVMVDDQTAPCAKNKLLLNCNLAPLKLSYGTDYKVTLVRLFRQQHVAGPSVLSVAVKTITATAVSQSSIQPGAVVYDMPQQFTLTTSKPLKNLGAVSLKATVNGVATPVPVSARFSGSTITVTAQTPLPRRAALDLQVADVTATDNSQLEQAYHLVFTTSGGPKVTGTNIPSTSVGFLPTISVSFDQTLLPTQDPRPLVSLLVNGAAHPATVTISGNRLIITPQVNFPVCARLTIQVTDAAQNQYGVTGDSAWKFSARAQCYTMYSIGTTAQGRPITAYQFGNGPSMVLYVGAMHGNEQNTKQLLQKWITELDTKPDDIPAGRSIVVIPSTNPDGVAANKRENSNTIDLNRNFPANNWQTVVTLPGGNNMPTNEGGPTALSEPESQALAYFVQTHRPRLVLTYHSHAAVVEANDAGDSVNLGTIYASKSGYKAIPTSAIGDTFDYSTTGAFEDWMNDKLGLPTLVVELRSSTADEFSLNRSAMWFMARL
ncbi:MAG: peptidase carboxypeptidase [Candidatus Saccharibacteria bacterium]|nr:peptidase carboxypeptidase [Candidatus Saccharibacteria bacterium]